jgi:FMN-dependent oxidoreductase (nitrilotriacetate monooxygenase family)
MRKMHLMAFLLAGPTSHHHGMWRHPETENAFLDPASWEHIARVLEQGCFDSVFFADIMAFYDFFGGTHDVLLGRGGQMGLLDPIPLLSVMARATRHIGLGATISTSFFNHFHIARTLATLDMISGGRAAWNVVTSAMDQEARNFGMTGLPGKNERYDRAEEVLQACVRLWESWDEHALILDKKGGRFVDPSKVRPIDYEGKWISSRGPNTVPRTPQGRPVIMQAGSSERGRAFCARHAEIVFTLQHSKQDMQEFYRDMKARVVAEGRDPDSLAILPSLDPIIGETDTIARERQAYMNDLVDPTLGLAVMSGHLGIDFSKYPLDARIDELNLDVAVTGSFDVIVQGVKSEGLTLGEAAKRFATSELTPQVVGAPETVADYLIDLFDDRACDGFIITPTVFPGTFEQFVRAVVPELQRRGKFRTEYSGTTLRENLRA